MRTISEIKQTMAEEFMNNEILSNTYGFSRGASFDNVFSSVSIESILLFVVATAIYILEGLFNQHQQDVDTLISEMIPHRPKWYRDKMLNFMKGMTLIPDTDKYNTEELTSEEIAAAKVVKYAAATENTESSLLTIKVAGESNGTRQPLDVDTQLQLEAYIREIKDAGVRISLVNQEADIFDCIVNVWYDPILRETDVKQNVENAITQYVEKDLPFNGEYTNMALVDVLQNLSGVKIVEVQEAMTSVEGEDTQTYINARYIPAAGYFKAGNITINMNVYDI